MEKPGGRLSQDPADAVEETESGTDAGIQYFNGANQSGEQTKGLTLVTIIKHHHEHS